MKFLNSYTPLDNTTSLVKLNENKSNLYKTNRTKEGSRVCININISQGKAKWYKLNKHKQRENYLQVYIINNKGGVFSVKQESRQREKKRWSV